MNVRLEACHKHDNVATLTAAITLTLEFVK